MWENLFRNLQTRLGEAPAEPRLNLNSPDIHIGVAGFHNSIPETSPVYGASRRQWLKPNREKPRERGS